MQDRTQEQPRWTLPMPSGAHAPLHVVRFDQDGACVSPAARAAFLDDAITGDYTHVLVMAHGWNNSWGKALHRFTTLGAGTLALTVDGQPRPMRPLVLGLFWPSIWITWPWESGPALAAQDPNEIADALALLPPTPRARLREALSAPALGAGEAHKLASVAAETLPSDDLTGDPVPPDPTVVLGAWSAVSAPALAPVQPRFGTATKHHAGEPDSAAWLLDPRDLVRLVSVWTMKDRADLVGRADVARLLDDLIAKTSAPVHLVGHSYGCRLLMSAIASMASEQRLTSLLLLQPAVNYLCFAHRLPSGGTGGYRPVLQRLRQPLLTTYSRNDRALTSFFHLALKRRRDLGEAVAAPWPYPPSPYAALGGYGPGEVGSECTWRDLPLPPDQHNLADAAKLHALNGTAHIRDHGDVSNEACCWALRSQLAWASHRAENE